MKKLTILILYIFLFGGCGTPHLSFTPKMEDGCLQFHIKLKNANGFLHMTLWEKDTRKTLWDINLNYYQGSKLKYGDVPENFTTFNGVRNSAKQNYPNNQVPSQIPVSKDIGVFISFQYDTLLSASSSSRCYAFRINPDGTILDLGEQPFPSEGKWADFYDSAEPFVQD